MARLVCCGLLALHRLRSSPSSVAVASSLSRFQNQRQMQHSSSYKVPAPAGPAGENLYKSAPAQKTVDPTEKPVP